MDTGSGVLPCPKLYRLWSSSTVEKSRFIGELFGSLTRQLSNRLSVSGLGTVQLERS